MGNLRDYLVNKRDLFVDTMDEEERRRRAIKQREAGAIPVIVESDKARYITSKDMVQQRDYSIDLDLVVPSDYVSQLSENDNIDLIKKALIDDKKQEDLPLITKDLMIYAFQIARGMEYLASRNVS